MKPYAAIPVPTFGQVIAEQAVTRGEATAVHFGDRTWSYERLDRHANRVACSLVRDGACPGDRIGYLGRNSDEVVLLALACARAALIFVPLNYRLAPLEIAHILNDADMRLLFLGAGYLAPGGSTTATREAADVIESGWLETSAAPSHVTSASTDPVLMIYTSGTTGLPKGVVLSHRSLFGTSTLRRQAAVAWDNWSEDDVTLVPIPLAHIAGFGMLVRTLFFGGEAIIQQTFDPGDVLLAIEHQRVSKIGLVPTAIKMILDHPRARAVDYSRIKTMIYGAAPITTDLLREALAVFGCQFAQSYGMTETSGTCAALPPEDHDIAGTPRMRSAGKPLPGTELRIVDDEGRTLPCGAIGEIAIRCISVMQGYWRMPEATAAVLDDDGWYRSGDAGYLDADGYLFIKDRLKDMIVSGAENIYPAEVENALADHPDVAQVAVIGVPDVRWGEAVKAIVVPKAGAQVDVAALIDWSKRRIADYKAPKSIDLVEALPMNAAGKILKAELRERYWTGAERSVN